MDFVHDQLATGHSYGCSRSLTFSPASRLRWCRGSPSAASTSWRCWNGFAMKWDSRRRSVSIKAASSCRAILTCGPTNAALRWNSPGLASPPTMRSSKLSTVASMPQRPLVPVPCGRPGKSGELAQILQSRIGTPISSETQHHQPCRRPHERKLGDQTKDDADKEPREERSCGRSQTSLYNEERPHGAIGNRPQILLQNHVGAPSPPT
jgi:hypothetical protein